MWVNNKKSWGKPPSRIGRPDEILSHSKINQTSKESRSERNFSQAIVTATKAYIRFVSKLKWSPINEELEVE